MAYRLTNSATIIIDRPIPTIDKVRENRPGIVVVEISRILIVEIAVAWEMIVTNREREKFCKYQDFAVDLNRKYEGKKEITVTPIWSTGQSLQRKTKPCENKEMDGGRGGQDGGRNADNPP